MCPTCGSTDDETIPVSDAHDWHRCRECGAHWWTEAAQEIYAEP